jgi:prophage regulatory protein
MAERLLRRPEVKARTGQSDAQIYEGIKNGTFPGQVPIGIATVGWVESEIEAWIQNRIALRDTTPKRKGGPGRGRRWPVERNGTDAGAA